MPGVSTEVSANHRVICRGGVEEWYPGGRIISSISRDPGNTSDINVLRPGLLMGRITSGGKYAPSILGVGGTAYASGTTLNVAVATVVEIVRRIGSTGTFKIAGPPSAAGVVKQETVTYSAVNQSTGDVTVTALTQAYVAASLILPTDGSEFPLTFIPEGYGVNVFDAFGTAVDQSWGAVPIKAVVYSTQIINYPADASTRLWLKGMLSLPGEGKFTFDDNY